MAVDTKVYRVTWDDGSERFMRLDDEDLKRWKALADDKTSTVKSVAAGTPTPNNARTAAKA